MKILRNNIIIIIINEISVMRLSKTNAAKAFKDKKIQRNNFSINIFEILINLLIIIILYT